MELFVVFEGVEGSGKTTQSRALKRRLVREGYQATLLQEPGGTPTGERIRRWLLKGGRDITPLAELFLFSASRAPLVQSVIRPALDRGEIVVCDRYIYSTVTYQGYGRGIALDTIRQINQIATGGLLPELVVLLDLAPDDGLTRKAGRPLDRIEQEQLEFHHRVRQGYLQQAREDPQRWLVLDSSQSIAAISDSIWKRVSKMLKGMHYPE